jgi:hypothetical protein
VRSLDVHVVNGLCLAGSRRGTDSVSDPGRETGDPEIVLGLSTAIERDIAVPGPREAGE